jgi:hypothetical protein
MEFYISAFAAPYVDLTTFVELPCSMKGNSICSGRFDTYVTPRLYGQSCSECVRQFSKLLGFPL